MFKVFDQVLQLPIFFKTTMTEYKHPGCGKCQGDWEYKDFVFTVDACHNE